MTLDYDALRAADSPNRNRRRPRFSPEVAKERQREQVTRANTAIGRAHRALAKAHPDDYRYLYDCATAEVAAERGPLPGDDA